MSLRVEDLKPGDVVRMEVHVVASHPGPGGYAYMTIAHTSVCVTDADLAAGNAERVQRPRPVRKGDEVRHDNGQVRMFVTTWRDGFLYGSESMSGCLWTPRDEWTHANGDPIDWEASE